MFSSMSQATAPRAPQMCNSRALVATRLSRTLGRSFTTQLSVSPAGLSRNDCGNRFARLFGSAAAGEEQKWVGPPVAALAPPGQCVLGDEWTACKLVSKVSVSHDTRVLTFALPDASSPLGLSTCACILANCGTQDKDGKLIVRPYTPVSTNAMIGSFELMVKVYPDGNISRSFDALNPGQTANFKHIGKNVKIQYPFLKPKLGMLVGGTGVAPMIQALHAVLGSEGDSTEISMLYGSKDSSSILAEELLSNWSSQAQAKDRKFSLTHVLSNEPANSTWQGEKGFMDRDRIAKHLPGPEEECMLFVCGPPAMYDVLCGPRDKPELTGLLAEMGYRAEQVVKF